MSDASYKYCPRCATSLVEKHIYHALRQVCPACGFIHFLEPKLVTVVVVRHEDTFLLGKRNIDPGKGLWSFVSGYVDRGEKVEEAALREVKEETNLDVMLEDLIGVFSEQGNPHVVIAYCARPINGAINMLRADPEEVNELAFYRLDEMPELAFHADNSIVEHLREK